MKIPLLDLKAEYAPIKSEILRALEEVLDGMQLYMGPNCRAFEEEFANSIGVRHAIGLSSGTDALLLAFMALGIKPDDEVIVPSHTFVATVAPLAFLGARPVFIDINPHNYTLNPDLLGALVTERTRAVVPVHLYGHAADMDRIVEFAQRHRLWVIEDVCQAVAGECRGKKLGSIGDIGCFSFVYTKNMKAYADAGAVTTNNDDLAEKIRRLRDHGRTDKYTHPSFGLNARLGELEAAILRIQLRHNEKRTEGRRDHASQLNSQLRNSGIGLPIEESYARHVYHLYVVRSAHRDELAAHLNERGIQTGIHYPIPCHLQGACRPYSRRSGSLPQTEKAAKEILSIPVYPELTSTQVQYIADAIIDFQRQPRRP